MPIEYEGDGISLQVLLQTFVCVQVKFTATNIRLQKYELAHLIITN